MRPRRVLAVVSPYALVREGVQQVVATRVPDISIGYSGASVTAASTLLGRTEHCAMVLDPTIERTSPHDVVQRVVALRIPVIVLSGSDDHFTVRACLRAGAKAFATLRTEPDQLADLITGVLKVRTVTTPAPTPLEQLGQCSLSLQEQRALGLYASGLTVSEVAAVMEVTPHTAKEYIDRVRRKSATTGQRARTKVELHQLARAVGLV